MLRILLTPRWIAGLAVAVIFAGVAIWLGTWQYDKHVDRAERRDHIEANYGNDPIPLDDVLPEIEAAGGLPSERGWTRVTMDGEYAVDDQLFVRNRPYRGTYGYHLAVPIQTGDAWVLVDRGWIPYGPDAATLPEVDPPPSGELTVTGWLRPSETGFDRSLPDGQLTSLNATEAREQTGLDVEPVYLLLESETAIDGEVPDRPQAADPPDTGVGSHFAYALQWWIASPLGLAMVWVFVRREHHDALAEAEGRDPRAPKVKKKKHRIWDDEDE